MGATYDEDFARLSANCRMHMKAGALDLFAFDLKQMGALLGREGKYVDKLKVLMLAFYIELSGVSEPPTIDRAISPCLMQASQKSGLSKYQIEELYKDTVRADTTPSHIMTVSDSLYLLELCMSGKTAEAEDILSRIGK